MTLTLSGATIFWLYKFHQRNLSERRRNQVTQNIFQFISEATFSGVQSQKQVFEKFSRNWKTFQSVRVGNRIVLSAFIEMEAKCKLQIDLKIVIVFLFLLYLQSMFCRLLSILIFVCMRRIWAKSTKPMHGKIIEHRCEIVIRFSRYTELTELFYPSKRYELKRIRTLNESKRGMENSQTGNRCVSNGQWNNTESAEKWAWTKWTFFWRMRTNHTDWNPYFRQLRTLFTLFLFLARLLTFRFDSVWFDRIVLLWLRIESIRRLM